MATYRHLGHLLRHTGLHWYHWRTPGREYENERFGVEVRLPEYSGTAPVPQKVIHSVRAYLSEQGRLSIKEFDQWLEWELAGRFRVPGKGPLTIVELEAAEPGTVLTMVPLYPQDWVPFQGVVQPLSPTGRCADSRIFLRPMEDFYLTPDAQFYECPGTNSELPFLFELHGGPEPPARAAARVYKVFRMSPT